MRWRASGGLPRVLEMGGILLLAGLLHLWQLESIPPGLDEDSAANGWLAVQWLAGGPFPFWNGRNGATEPLMVLLQALTTTLWGPNVAALRVVSALAFALAAPVVYGLVWEIGRGLHPFVQRWGARLAGLALATSPAVLELGRTGLRATLLPLALAIFAWLLLIALRTHQTRAWLAAGVALGVVGYTYLAARAVPLAVGLFLLIHLVHLWSTPGSAKPHSDNPEARTRMLAGVAWLGAGALIVLLPQILFFLQYPFAFWSRAGAVTLAQNPLAEEAGYSGVLFQKLAHMARLFGIAWGGQYNQGARPLLPPPIFVGFLAVWPLVWRALWRRTYHAGLLFMAVLLPVMLVPDLLGGDRIEPHSLRVIGIVVPAFALAGLGLAWLLERWWQLRRWSGAYVPGAAGLGLVACLLVAGWGAGDWLGRVQPNLAQSTYSWYAREDVALARWLNAQNEAVLLPVYELSRTNLAYLTVARGTLPQGALRAPDAPGVPHDTESAQANGVHWQPPVDAWMTDPAARVWLVRMAEPVRPRVEASSYRYDERAQALLLPESGGDSAARSTWLLPPLAAETLPRLWDEVCADSVEIGVDDPDGLRTFAWACPVAPTELNWHTVPEIGAPEIGDPEIGTRTGFQPTDPVQHTGYVFGAGLHIAAAELDLSGAASPVSSQPQTQMAVNMLWEAVGGTTHPQESPADPTGWRMFVHLVDDQFQRLVGEDFMPAYGLYGTPMWQPGEGIPLRQLIPRPAHLPPGRYWLEVGLYDPLTGAHSRVYTDDGIAVEQGRFGPLKMAAPPPAGEFKGTPAAAVFDGTLRLDSFVVETQVLEAQEIQGEEVTVRMRWTTLQSPDADYTFFIHLTDGAGNIVAQRDAQPTVEFAPAVNGSAYPTGIWSRGEVVETKLTATRIPEAGATSDDVYTLWLGAYVWDSLTQAGTRVPVALQNAQSAQNAPLTVEADRLRLTTLRFD